MAQIIQVQIGEEIIDLDIDLTAITMREAISLEESLGGEEFDKLMKGEASMRPSLIRAVIFAKLHTLRPDIPLDGFDLDLGALYETLTDEGDSPKLQGVG